MKNNKFVFNLTIKLVHTNSKMDTIKPILDLIRKIREEKKMSQDALAKKINLSQSQYGKLENDGSEIKLKQFFDICEALEVHPIDILNLSYPHQKTLLQKNNDLLIQHKQVATEIKTLLEKITS